MHFPAWRRPIFSSRILPKPGEAAVQYHVVFSAGDWESFFFFNEQILTVPTGDISDFVLEPQISGFFGLFESELGLHTQTLAIARKLWLAWSPLPNNSENETNSDNGWSPGIHLRRAGGVDHLHIPYVCPKSPWSSVFRASHRWVWTTWSTRHPMRCLWAQPLSYELWSSLDIQKPPHQF